jgi:hypothetical protein
MGKGLLRNVRAFLLILHDNQKTLIMDRTITVKIKTFDQLDVEFKEFEFPEVKKYLEQGYHIVSVIPDALIAGTNGRYYITFHLRK